MTGWIKNPNDKHLNRVDANLGNNSGLERNLRKKGLVKHKVDQGTHNNILYPPWTTKPSCFSISALWNVSLELKHQYTYILLKFMGIEGTYQFLWEFEEICSMMWKHPSWTQISLVSFNWYQLASLYCQYQITKTKWAKLDLLVECTTHLSMINLAFDKPLTNVHLMLKFSQFSLEYFHLNQWVTWPLLRNAVASLGIA